jgi:hypothetical protein
VAMVPRSRVARSSHRMERRMDRLPFGCSEKTNHPASLSHSQ